METELTIPVTLEETSFRKFADFDAHVLNKRWLPSVAAGAVMLLCAVVSFFIMTDAALIGGALLCFGIGVPISYVQRRAVSLKKQIQDNHLEKPRLVYTVHLSRKGVAQQIGETVSPVVPWEKLIGAWRTEHAIYLYVLPNRALLFPEGGVPLAQNDLWTQLQTHLDASKLHTVQKAD